MKKTVFLLLLAAMFAPWATQAQTPTILFSEGFDDGVVPEGWTNEYSWDFISRGDGYCARERTGTSDNNKLITPVIDLTTANIARLRFTYAQTVNRGYHDRLQVFYRTAANESWTLLFENTEAVGSYTQVELELPNISSSYQIAFGKNYNDGGGVYLDDVVVDEIPCPRPVGIEVAGFTGTTTTLSWTERGSASAWQICLNGDENNLINASTNPFTLTGLTPETINTAKVRAVCGSDEQSEWSDPVSFEPTDKVVIGPNQEDGSYRGILPCATEYSYSLTEQIYTTAELGAAGTVLSIDFYCINNNNNELSRRLDIYMVPTDQTSFSDAQSYITATEGHCVYNSSYAGSVVFQPGSGWTTIELTTPFNYDGVHNVAILVHDKSEWNVSDAWYYSNVLMFHTFSTGDVSQSIYLTTNNNVGHNPTSTLGTFNPPVQEKNQIRLLKVTCMPPTGLAVDNVTNTTATLSWTERGDATEWVMEYADNSNFNNSQLVDVDDNPTTTISGLNSGTQYYARVRANCGNDDLSPWSNPLVFNTDFCTPSDKCEIFYELTMDYPEPMGLNGDGINVIDNVTGLVIARLTIGNSIYDDNSGEELVPNTPDETDGVTYARGSFMVCNGRNIRFEWINDDWATEYCGYTFRDLDYNEIEVEVSSGEEEDDDNNEFDNTYFVNCNAYSCLRPTNLAISDVTMEDATLSWTDRNGATSWTLQYCVDFTEEPQEVNVIDNPTYDFEGLESGTTYYVRVKSNCGGDDGESEWSLPFNFTTSLCMPEDQCAISYELTDSYGDGWNGAAIMVMAVNPTDYSETVIATWTIPSNNTGGGWKEKSGDNVETDGASYARGTLSVCDGSEIMFRWQGGGCDEECSFTIYDPSGVVFFSGTGMDIDEMGGDDRLEKSGEENLPPITSLDVNCSGRSIGANSWYAISAYTQGGYSLGSNDGLTSGADYDLYRYNEATASWENYKNTNHSDFTSLVTGRGYIYRSAYYTTLDFGTANEGNVTSVYALTNTGTCPDANLQGFNLIGNPYQQAIYKGVNFPATNLTTGFYSLENDGSWRVHTDNDPIAVGEGVLVKFNGSNQVYLSFTEGGAKIGGDGDLNKGASKMGLRFSVVGCGHEDVAYAMLNSQHSEGLPKVSHLNAEAPSLSISQGGTDYAIAMIDGSTQAFPLKFRAVGNGEYTVSVSGDMSEMGYLHLIDRATGSDIDLLSQPTYTFTNTRNQSSTQRFTVKLSPNADEEGNGIFAYQNGDRIVVEGAGTLHVYDVLGRQLYTHEINSQLSIPNSQFPGTGVYILRLGEKSQKLVIK